MKVLAYLIGCVVGVVSWTLLYFWLMGGTN